MLNQRKIITPVGSIGINIYAKQIKSTDFEETDYTESENGFSFILQHKFLRCNLSFTKLDTHLHDGYNENFTVDGRWSITFDLEALNDIDSIILYCNWSENKKWHDYTSNSDEYDITFNWIYENTIVAISTGNQVRLNRHDDRYLSIIKRLDKLRGEVDDASAGYGGSHVYIENMKKGERAKIRFVIAWYNFTEPLNDAVDKIWYAVYCF